MYKQLLGYCRSTRQGCKLPIKRQFRLDTAPVHAEDYFLERAAKCRRLAEKIANPADPALAALLELATEFESKAAAAKRQSVSARAAS